MVVSCGGAQSNSMRALADLTYAHDVPFVYITPSLPDSLSSIIASNVNLLSDPMTGENVPKDQGNLEYSLSRNMQLIQVSREEFNKLNQRTASPFLNNVLERSLNNNGKMDAVDNVDDCGTFKFSYTNQNVKTDVLWIPQGGSDMSAYPGIVSLAGELLEFILSSDELAAKQWRICVESGTGTTALFLQRAISTLMEDAKGTVDVKVIAVPCVSDDKYLASLIHELDVTTGGNGVSGIPHILSTSSTSKSSFAKPTKEHWDIWSELQSELNIPFDLIYAPRAWELIFSQWNIDVEMVNSNAIMYIHCGGVEGNFTQLKRYERMGFVYNLTK